MSTAIKKRSAPSSSSSGGGVEEAMTSKKTALIIVTVIGCIAILWPKVFHPMMFGPATVKPNIKDPRGGGPGGCCDVVLDREEFLNASKPNPEPFVGPHLYRKQINLYTGEISLRQERPAHLHPESIYQAMRERGRAIPATPTVPIVERKNSPSNPPPRIVDGRPGPIPGMRPPMGAGAVHHPAQQRGGGMGFLMPLYTIGIVLFFGYTIMKIAFKKQVPNAPYGPAPTDPSFRQEVFGHSNHSQVEDLGNTKLGWREHQTRIVASTAAKGRRSNGTKELYNASLSATEVATNLQQQQQQQRQSLAEVEKTMFNKETEQLMEIEKLRKKLEDTERAMAKLIAEMNTDQYEAKQNDNENRKPLDKQNISNGHTNIDQDEQQEQERSPQTSSKPLQQKRRDISAEREMMVLGMELTASCEGGQKWNAGRPPTPVFRTAQSEHSKLDESLPEPQSIYLEGALAHEGQILVADSQIKREEVYDAELNGSSEEPAVILSSKMTLSLINVDSNQQICNPSKPEIESPLADDIEIIGHYD
ncbi:resistance to inhibitors of cholinesterase protein 3 isoform X1 [Drosophila tropicalis]|uniref:resistance to inhibitors of cholinesterase protein 3 isoform X1 n=1 Tax=Drosophila tropicalis TaxID=46794 RepID=UPI0035ABDE0F